MRPEMSLKNDGEGVAYSCLPANRERLEGISIGDSLLSALSRQWGDTPWYLGSLGVHLFVLVLFLIFVPVSNDVNVPDIKITSEIDPPLDTLPEPVTDFREPIDLDVSASDTAAPSVGVIDIAIPKIYESAPLVEADPVEGAPSESDTIRTMGIGEEMSKVFTPVDGGRPLAGSAYNSRSSQGRAKGIKNNGGGREAERAVRRGLAWLARQQKSDGSWEMPADASAGSRRIQTNSGLTALCTLAFLGAGNTASGSGKYQRHVRRAESYLLNFKHHEGGRSVAAPLAYEAPLILMALAESYGMGSENRNLKRKVEDLIALSIERQLPNGGFPETLLDRDGSWHNTTWWLSALKSARLSGFKVPDSVFEKSFEEMFRCIQFEAAGEAEIAKGSNLYANVAELPGSPRIEGGTSSKMALSMVVYLLNTFKGIGLEDQRIRGMCNLMALAGTNNNGIWDWPGGNVRIHDRFSSTHSYMPLLFKRPDKTGATVRPATATAVTPYFSAAAGGFAGGAWGKPGFSDKLELASVGDRLRVDQSWYGACYWYWQGYSFSRLGAQTEYWRAYNNSFMPYLVYTQGQADGWPKAVTVDQGLAGKLETGDIDGAWPGAFSRNGSEPFNEMGQAAATAFCCLLLEVYYRY